ncbi:MAG: hypothetical protein AAFQ87_20365 [Bacteroidota bacterium]
MELLNCCVVELLDGELVGGSGNQPTKDKSAEADTSTNQHFNKSTIQKEAFCEAAILAPTQIAKSRTLLLKQGYDNHH